MSIYQHIRQFFSRTTPPKMTPQACPNCWGYVQWEGKDCPTFIDIDKGQPSEVASRNGFIRNFVKRVIG